MQLTPGTRIGVCEIIGMLGAGGMGEVYRARDTRLNREVAVKILPEAFAADADRVARFQREAEVLATLNHPNVAQIYGFEDGRALVLELVDGPTLADRIANGPIPLDDALPIARQIADALEAAHERGIVHRDLKPANIKITTDGKVKVLDFGLAKATQGPADAGHYVPDLSNSPTLTSPALATHAGVILGTAAYMSPEQAKGKSVDRRTDMWAFGCVLYEMLTAKRAFEGADVTDTLAEILKGTPDLRAMPTATPEPIARLIRRCLAKDSRARLADAGAARLEIDEAMNPPAVQPMRGGVPRASSHARVAWSVAALSVLAAAGAVAVPRFLAVPPTEPPTARFTMSLPARTTVIGVPFIPAVSPDGRHVAFNSFPGAYRGSEIWIRSLDASQPRPIPGVDSSAFAPFWSPDSARLGFSIVDDVKAIPVAGGVAETICEGCRGFGGSWGPDGTILLGTRKGIVRVPAGGGEPRLVTHVKEGPRAFHVWPQFLPDGRRFIYFSSPDNAVHLGSLDSAEARELLKTDAQAQYVPPGHLLFTRQGTLYVQAFDHSRAELSGPAVQIASEIALLPNDPHAAFSASNNGLLVYRSLEGVSRPASKIVWLNRQGQVLGEVAGRFDDRIIDLSPTSAYAVIDRFDSSSTVSRDLWLVDLRRGTSTRVTSDSSDECCAVWSPDGKRIVFNSSREGTRNLYEIEPDSMEPPRLLLKTPFPKYPKDWSPDGRSIVFETIGSNTGRDLWILPLIGERVPTPIIQTAADESSGRISPDGRWIAYVSNQSGRYEVYVQSLVDRGRGRLQVSTEGGFFPRWRGDGHEIFYVAPNRKLMAVAVAPKVQQLELGVPQPLFDIPISDPATQQFTDKYDVTPDGQRFLVLQIIDEQTSVDLTVVLNWATLLRK